MDVSSPGMFVMSLHPPSILWGGPKLSPGPHSFQNVSDLWKMLLGSPRRLNPANSLRKAAFPSLSEPVACSSRGTMLA